MSLKHHHLLVALCVQVYVLEVVQADALVVLEVLDIILENGYGVVDVVVHAILLVQLVVEIVLDVLEDV